MGEVVRIGEFEKKRGPGRPKKPETIENEKKKEQQQLKVEKQVAAIKKRHKAFLKSLKNSGADNKTNLKILKYCLDMSLRLMPIVEASVVTYKNDRAVYAVKALTEQTREIMDDMRMLSDNDRTVDFLLNQALIPGMQLLLQHIVHDYTDLKNTISSSLPPKKAKAFKIKINKMLKNQAALLDDMKAGLEKKVEEYFQ